MDLYLILFITFSGIYSISKESKYTAVFLSINNKTLFFSLLCLPSKIHEIGPSFILSKLSPELTALNLCSCLKCLVILILLKGWGRSKNLYPFYHIFL